jgi:hypothetical protein
MKKNLLILIIICCSALKIIAAGTTSLHLTVYFQGLYQPGGTMIPSSYCLGCSAGDVENVIVSLSNKNSPHLSITSFSGNVKTDGTIDCTFTIPQSDDYYIVITSFSTIETWSSTAISFVIGGTTNFNFSTPQGQSYGPNEALVSSSPITYALFTTDFTWNGGVDLDDYLYWQHDNLNFVFGPGHPTDVNADQNVDLGDFPYLEQTLPAFCGLKRPQ